MDDSGRQHCVLLQRQLIKILLPQVGIIMFMWQLSLYIYQFSCFVKFVDSRTVNSLMCGYINDFQNNKFWYFFLKILVDADADADASLFFWGSRKEQKQNLNPGQSTGWVAVKRSANTSITLSIVLANNNANENVKAGSNQRHAHLKVKIGSR